MSDPVITHVTENWRIYGFIATAGGLGTMVTVLTRNVTALWKLKQDKTVCFTEHISVKSDIAEIKDNVKWLVRRANGGKGA